MSMGLFSDRNTEMTLPDDRYSVMILLSIKNKQKKRFFPSLKQQWIYRSFHFEWANVYSNIYHYHL